MKKTRPHKILVVEDSEALLTYLSEILQLHKYEVALLLTYLSEILQLHKYEVALARTFAEAEGYVRSVFVFRDGRTARLTYKETALLRYLYAKAGAPSGAEELLLNIWKASPAETETTCVSAFPPRSCLFLSDSCIKNLRKPGLRRFFPFFFRSFLWPSSFFCGRPLSRLSLIFR